MCDEAPPSKKPKPDEESEPNFADDLDLETESFQVGDQFQNFVRPEELEKLREFTVLDEVKSNDEDSGDEETDDDGMETVVVVVDCRQEPYHEVPN